MARKTKIDNALLKRFARDESKHQRKIDSKEKRVYFLIICEGSKTEPLYFKSFTKDLPLYTLDIEAEGLGFDPMGVVDRAIERKISSVKKYDRIWVVFDKDDFPTKAFNNAIKKAEANKIGCAWSNEAFELWYILHFHYLDARIDRADYQSYIEREMNKQIHAKGSASEKKKTYTYEKNAQDTYALLAKYGDQGKAIEWAKKLVQKYSSANHASHNPCTRVFALVEELNNPQKVVE